MGSWVREIWYRTFKFYFNNLTWPPQPFGFVYISMAPKLARLFRYVCKADWDLKNIKIPKLNVTSQYESDDPVQAFELGFLRFWPWAK